MGSAPFWVSLMRCVATFCCNAKVHAAVNYFGVKRLKAALYT